MPNFKIFQDNPDQARIKVYGNNNVAFNTDIDGNLAITSTGLAVTGNVDVGTVSVTTGGNSLSVCIGTGDIPITSTGLAVTGNIDVGTVTITTGGNSLSVCIGTGDISITSTGLAVTGNINVGTVTITTGANQLAVCLGTGYNSISIDSLGSTEIDEVIANQNNTAYTGATQRTVLGYNAWTFAVKNTSTEINAQALVQIQMSATAESDSDWLQEVAPVTLNPNSVAFLTSSLLVKYARVYYAAVDAASAITLNITYQAQH